jgi:ribosomal protein S18 acetylase RimI-like enzyme
MIKLTDLFNEIELRPGQLEPEAVDDNYLYESFFQEFLGIDLDERNLDLSKPVDSSIFSKIKKSVIDERGGYQLAIPSSFYGKTYILNPSADNFMDYIVGYIEVQKVYSNYKFTKAYKVQGAQIYLSYVSTPYRGKGIGVLAYEMILEAYKNLFSDDILYEGSRNLWVKKIIPMTKGKGGFFGAEVFNMYIPLSTDDAADDEVASNVDRYFASLNPPAEVKKLESLVGNYEITSGDLWIYEFNSSDNELFDLIDEYEDDVDSGIADLIDDNKEYFANYIALGDEPKAAIIRTKNAVVVLNQTSEGIKSTLL